MSMSPSNPASLLISLHDVSPLTLPECEQAVALLAELGKRDLARTWFEQGIALAKQKGDAHALSELESALAEL